MFISIPVGMVIGFILGYWYKTWRDNEKMAMLNEMYKDICDAKKLGFEYINGGWAKKGV